MIFLWNPMKSHDISICWWWNLRKILERHRLSASPQESKYRSQTHCEAHKAHVTEVEEEKNLATGSQFYWDYHGILMGIYWIEWDFHGCWWFFSGAKMWMHPVLGNSSVQGFVHGFWLGLGDIFWGFHFGILGGEQLSWRCQPSQVEDVSRKLGNLVDFALVFQWWLRYARVKEIEEAWDMPAMKPPS